MIVLTDEFVDDLLSSKNHYTLSHASSLFKSVIRESEVKLNDNSFKNLFYLASQTLKYQLLAIAHPMALESILFGHLERIRRFCVPATDILVLSLIERLQKLYPIPIHLVEQCFSVVLFEFQSKRVKVSILQDTKRQGKSGYYMSPYSIHISEKELGMRQRPGIIAKSGEIISEAGEISTKFYSSNENYAFSHPYTRIHAIMATMEQSSAGASPAEHGAVISPLYSTKISHPTQPGGMIEKSMSGLPLVSHKELSTDMFCKGSLRFEPPSALDESVCSCVVVCDAYLMLRAGEESEPPKTSDESKEVSFAKGMGTTTEDDSSKSKELLFEFGQQYKVDKTIKKKKVTPKLGMKVEPKRNLTKDEQEIKDKMRMEEESDEGIDFSFSDKPSDRVQKEDTEKKELDDDSYKTERKKAEVEHSKDSLFDVDVGIDEQQEEEEEDLLDLL
ncbi:Organic solute carrier protein 1 like protein [Aduncisulcus paluster]|uniref:Organic solute carrier protein 1 like protein n=1 Tax=Aduncisulcus paluster TaxID=2918883 RepID=A0ABQ5K5R8_9EUKA|nr:Organic solute carrier protein 1 like protein [Aduncisulcus paluster]